MRKTVSLLIRLLIITLFKIMQLRKLDVWASQENVNHISSGKLLQPSQEILICHFHLPSFCKKLNFHNLRFPGVNTRGKTHKAVRLVTKPVELVKRWCSNYPCAGGLTWRIARNCMQTRMYWSKQRSKPKQLLRYTVSFWYRQVKRTLLWKWQINIYGNCRLKFHYPSTTHIPH